MAPERSSNESSFNKKVFVVALLSLFALAIMLYFPSKRSFMAPSPMDIQMEYNNEQVFFVFKDNNMFS